MTRGRWLFPSLLLVACGRTASPPQPIPPAAAPAYRITTGNDDLRYEAAGGTRAARRAELATRLMGTVEEVHVHAGDRVTTGSLLLRLNAATPEAGLAAARAGFQLASTTLRRTERLFADSAVAEAQLDAARSAYAQAEAQVRAAEAEHGYAEVRAPFPGVITARLAEPGDLTTPGRPLLVIEADGPREIVVGVPDDLLDRVRPGLSLSVRVGAAGNRIEARVIGVVPVSDPASRTVEVRLSAPPGTPSGVPAVAEIPIGSRRGLQVPAEALIRRGQLTGVLVFAPDSTVRLRWLRVGRLEHDQVEVLAGLSEGDLVAMHPERLQDGVRALPAPAATTP